MFQYYHSMQQESTGNESVVNLLPPWNLCLIDKQSLAPAFEFSFSFLNVGRKYIFLISSTSTGSLSFKLNSSVKMIASKSWGTKKQTL